MKKITFTIMAIMLFTAGSFAQTVYKYPLVSDVVEANGSGKDGATVGGVTFVADATRGSDVAVLGTSNGHLTLPSILNGHSEATISIWFRNDLSNKNWSKLFSLGKGESGGGGHREGIFLTPYSDWQPTKPFFTTFVANEGVWAEDGYDPGAPVVGEWHHYAVSISTTEAITYVDGVAVVTVALPDFNLATIDDTENYIGLGYWPDPAITGAVSDLQIHTQALSQAEVTTIMNGGALAVENYSVLEASISMYPNPANAMVKISAQEFKAVEIFNSLGQSVLKLDGGRDLEVNTSKFNTGIYIVKFSNDDMSIAKKLLIK